MKVEMCRDDPYIAHYASYYGKGMREIFENIIFRNKPKVKPRGSDDYIDVPSFTAFDEANQLKAKEFMDTCREIIYQSKVNAGTRRITRRQNKKKQNNKNKASEEKLDEFLTVDEEADINDGLLSEDDSVLALQSGGQNPKSFEISKNDAELSKFTHAILEDDELEIQPNASTNISLNLSSNDDNHNHNHNQSRKRGFVDIENSDNDNDKANEPPAKRRKLDQNSVNRSQDTDNDEEIPSDNTNTNSKASIPALAPSTATLSKSSANTVRKSKRKSKRNINRNSTAPSTPILSTPSANTVKKSKRKRKKKKKDNNKGQPIYQSLTPPSPATLKEPLSFGPLQSRDYGKYGPKGQLLKVWGETDDQMKITIQKDQYQISKVHYDEQKHETKSIFDVPEIKNFNGRKRDMTIKHKQNNKNKKKKRVNKRKKRSDKETMSATDDDDDENEVCYICEPFIIVINHP